MSSPFMYFNVFIYDNILHVHVIAKIERKKRIDDENNC